MAKTTVSAAKTAHWGLVGPNAVLQTTAVLRTRLGQDRCNRLFEGAGLGPWMDGCPTDSLIDQDIAVRLHQSVRQALTPAVGRQVLAEAGQRTGQYVLRNRIPAFAQLLIRSLPAPLGARLLTWAIKQHAWTFVGTGRFSVRSGNPIYLTVEANPFAVSEASEAPVCAWHIAAFESLFQALISSRARVEEVACCAAGAPACIYAVYL